MEDLSLHLLDLLQNAVRADAKNIEVSVTEDALGNRLTLCVKDDGYGMDAATVACAAVSGFTTKQDDAGGQGLALLKESAELAGGGLLIKSAPKQGSEITATFALNHPDRKPLGDIAGTFTFTIASYPELHFILNYQKNDLPAYRFDTNELYAIMDGYSIQCPEMIISIKEMIKENIEEHN